MQEPKQVQRFIEKIARNFEIEGAPGMAGRVFGLLLLTPGELSLDQIAERLGVSKGSVSTNARYLERLGLVERYTVPGERRDYYGMGQDMYRRMLETRLARLEQARETFQDLGDLSPDLHPKVRRRIDDLTGAYAAIIAASRHLLANRRMQADKTARAAPAVSPGRAHEMGAKGSVGEDGEL